MSAFLVSDKHILSLLAFAAKQEYPYIYLPDDGGNLNVCKRFNDPVDRQWMAETLKAENVRSLCYRYETDKPEDYDATITAPAFLSGATITAVQALKACDCYDYQACETDDYETTVAHRIVNGIRGLAISALPGYEKAAWEIS